MKQEELQKLINENSGGFTIVVPAGIHVMKETLCIPKNVIIEGRPRTR